MELEETGDCFEAAANLMMSVPDSVGMTLVHGVVTGQGKIEGVRHPHAWVELEDMAIDVSNGKSILMDRARYYAIGHIKEGENCYYTGRDMRMAMLEHGTYGPWREDLLSMEIERLLTPPEPVKAHDQYELPLRPSK